MERERDRDRRNFTVQIRQEIWSLCLADFFIFKKTDQMYCLKKISHFCFSKPRVSTHPNTGMSDHYLIVDFWKRILQQRLGGFVPDFVKKKKDNELINK